VIENSDGKRLYRDETLHDVLKINNDNQIEYTMDLFG
jgi:hypothetical protein